MLPRLLRLHPSTYKRLIRLSKEAERDGAYRVAKRLRAVVLNSEGHQRRTGGDPAVAAIEGVGVAPAVSGGRCGWSAGRLSSGPAIATHGKATTTVGGHSRQRSGGLRFGYRDLDLADDCLGDRGGVRRSLPSGPCAQIASRRGIFGAAAPPRTGARRRSGAGQMAPPHLSPP